MQVRNSAGGIVQLTYGEDGLDPVAMEAAEGKPINLARSMSVVHATTPRPTSLPENALQDGETNHLCMEPPCSHRPPLEFARLVHLLRELPGSVLDVWMLTVIICTRLLLQDCLPIIRLYLGSPCHQDICRLLVSCPVFVDCGVALQH